MRQANAVDGDATTRLARAALMGPLTIELTAQEWQTVAAGHELLSAAVADGRPVYGANTPVGAGGSPLTPESSAEFQSRLVTSYMVGVGTPLSDDVVRTIMVLKMRGLAEGYSGVRPVVVEHLQAMLNGDCLPIVPSRGSVGASGDLAPLAHVAGAVMGHGRVRINGVGMSAVDGLARVGLRPLRLEAKEGAALMNGTQASTAIALQGLIHAEAVFDAALVAGALTMSALGAQVDVLDDRIHALRRQRGQRAVAARLRDHLGETPDAVPGSGRPFSQDPYSLRCQPQVLGAALDLLRLSASVITREAGGITDNPILFADGSIVNGGNFHAQPIAFAADVMALALAEVGSISDRKIALLVGGGNGLPAGLIAGDGLDMGLKPSHVTASALVAENRALAAPCGIDSIPTSGNGQDHVSMATYAALRVTPVAENLAAIVAIEMLAAAQAADLRGHRHPTDALREAHRGVRSFAEVLERDRPLVHEIEAVRSHILAGGFSSHDESFYSDDEGEPEG